MIIALDYDGTYTKDPALWDQFIHAALVAGHKVVCVTARRDTEENRKDVKMPIPVYFTSLSAKLWYMEKRGVKVDVWIDDEPDVVMHGK